MGKVMRETRGLGGRIFSDSAHFLRSETADAATEDVPLQEHEIVRLRLGRQLGNVGMGMYGLRKTTGFTLWIPLAY